MSDKSAFPIGEHVFYQRFFFSNKILFINILTCGNLDAHIFDAYIATIIAKSKHSKRAMLWSLGVGQSSKAANYNFGKKRAKKSNFRPNS